MNTKVADRPRVETVKVRQGTGPRSMVSVLLRSWAPSSSDISFYSTDLSNANDRHTHPSCPRSCL